MVAPRSSTSEAEFLSGLGEVVFNALDYGNGDDDDLELPDELENLLSYMIGTVDEDTNDDGFCENKITIRNVLKMCKKHSGSEHKEHYKKVVKVWFCPSGRFGSNEAIRGHWAHMRSSGVKRGHMIKP